MINVSVHLMSHSNTRRTETLIFADQ